jgi:hypothetical protein
MVNKAKLTKLELMAGMILARLNSKWQRERERERAEIIYTGNVNGKDLAVKVDLLEYKKEQVDEAFEILGSISDEDSIENLKEIGKKIKKLKDAKLPEELSYECLLAKVNALDNLNKAIDDKPKRSFFGSDADFLTDIGRVLRTLQGLIPEDNDASKKVAVDGSDLSDEQIAAYEKLKDEADDRE